jgi:PPK2 family polyphosphate:nucleotide phosphotransferase
MPDKLLDELIVKPGSTFKFSERDPAQTFGWTKRQARSDLAKVADHIDELQQKLAAQRSQSLLVVLQAIDAGGKDGTIRRVFGPLSAAGVTVSDFKVPAGSELEHDYLWRVHAVTPRNGEIGVWNRSHYEEVLAVRVKNLVPKERWEKRYRHIREFERMLVDEGTAIIKINLHISRDEQRVRLQQRIDDPLKRWKFRAGDLEDRKLWPQYMKAFEVAFDETSTVDAPWFVVPANHKWVRDLAVARILRDRLEAMDPQLPPVDPAILGVRVE